MPIETPELILSKHIVGAKTFSIKHDWTKLRKKSNGEYTDASQMLHFGKAKFFDGLVKHWHTYAFDKSSIIYNVNVEHSQETAARFRAAGVSCEHLDGTMPQDERDRILQRYRTRETIVLCNVHLLTTGNDEKITECIGLNRKVGLISTATQIAGRGARSHVFDNGRQKSHFVCLDMGANHERHGVFGSRVDWKGIFEDPQSISGNESSNTNDSITCSNCAGVNARRLTNCIYCNQSLAKDKKPKKSLQDLCAPDPKRLQEIKQEKMDNLPPDLIGKTPAQMTDSQLYRYIEIMGYNKNYYWVIKKKRKEKRHD